MALLLARDWYYEKEQFFSPMFKTFDVTVDGKGKQAQKQREQAEDVTKKAVRQAKRNASKIHTPPA